MDACNNIAFLRVVYYIKQILGIAFILIPIGLIVFLSLDFARSVISSEEDMRKNLKIAIKRLIYAVVVFLVPFIVSFVIKNLVSFNVNFKKCLEVDYDTIKAQIIVNKKECITNGNTWDDSSSECILDGTESTTKKENSSKKKAKVVNSSKKVTSSKTTKKSLRAKFADAAYVVLKSTGVVKDVSAKKKTPSIEKAIEWAKDTAANNKVGYSQGATRRRLKPDVDCSSFVYYSLVRGGKFSKKKLGHSPFNTSTMRRLLENAGFHGHTLRKKSKLKPGDVLWKSGHTELYVGKGKCVGAHWDYDGKKGDSSHKEVNVQKCTLGFVKYYRYKGK